MRSSTRIRELIRIRDSLALTLPRRVRSKLLRPRPAMFALLRKQMEREKTLPFSHSKYQIQRYNSDPQYRMARYLRTKIRTALNKNSVDTSATYILGCSIEDLRKYLQELFTSGMTWQNHSRIGWHIDHIRPLSSFDLTNEQEVKLACHYTNLQPLWAADNIKKGSRYVT